MPSCIFIPSVLVCFTPKSFVDVTFGIRMITFFVKVITNFNNIRNII